MQNKPIRILHVVGGMNNAGLEAFIMNIYRKIDRTKIQFDFAVLNKNETYYFDEIKSLGGNIYIQLDPKEVGLKKFEQGLYNTIKENGPYECVHSHIYYFNGSILKVAKKCGVRVRISHSHNTRDGKNDGFIRTLYRKYMQTQILNNATHLIGCTKQACESLHGDKCWKDNRSSIMYNAINLELYSNLTKKSEEYRKTVGIPLGVPVVGHIGRFVEQKNHKYLIEVFEQFLNKKPDAKLVLVGDGPLRSEIEKLAIDKGINDSVMFLGIRKDIPDILAAIDVFVFPSLFEGLGIVLIEAQASGLNCVISDTIPEEVDLGLGLINKLSLDDNPQKWSDTLIELISKERCEYNMIEKSITESGYEINDLVSKIEYLYTH